MTNYQKLKQIVKQLPSHTGRKRNKLVLKESRASKSGGGWFLYTVPEIVICEFYHNGTKRSDERKLTTLAHELGHYLSFASGRQISSYFIARIKYNTYTYMSEREKILILREEKRAWRMGFEFLQKEGFTITKRMIRRQNSAINGYLKSLEMDK